MNSKNDKLLALKLQLAEVSKNPTNPEQDHAHADKLVCDMLIVLGHPEAAEHYLAVEKWYS
jgi:hypothetical protein